MEVCAWVWAVFEDRWNILKMGTQASKISLGAVSLEQPQMNATRREWKRSFKTTGVWLWSSWFSGSRDQSFNPFGTKTYRRRRFWTSSIFMPLSQPVILQSSEHCFSPCLSFFHVSFFRRYPAEQKSLYEYYLPTPATCPTDQSITKLTTLSFLSPIHNTTQYLDTNCVFYSDLNCYVAYLLQGSPNGSACFILPPHSWDFEVTHNDAPQSVGLPWTRGQLVTKTSTW